MGENGESSTHQDGKCRNNKWDRWGGISSTITVTIAFKTISVSSGYCLVGKIPPPPLGGVGVEMGRWVSPKFQHFGPPGTPPPLRVRFFLGFGLCRALRPV